MVIIRNSRRWVHYAGAAEMSATETAARVAASPPVRRQVPRAVRRRAVGVADHSLLIVAAIAFVAPFVFMA